MRRLVAVLFAVLLLSVSLPSSARAASVQNTWVVGPQPFGLSIDPSTGRVFVPVSTSFGSAGSLALLDPSTSSVTGVGVGSQADVSVFDPVLRRAFVTTSVGSLAIVDVDAGTLVDVLLGRGQLGIALDPATHRVFASIQNGITVTDGATGALVAQTSAPAGEKWWGIAFDASSGRVYALNDGGGTAGSLVVLNAADLSLVADISLPELPRWGLAVDEGRQVVYVAGYSGAGNLYGIDASTLQLVRTVPIGGFPLWVTHDPARDELIISRPPSANLNRSDLIGINAASLTQTFDLPFPYGPGPSAVGPDGRLYVSDNNNKSVSAVLLTNTAPVIDSVTLTPPAPGTNDVLSASVAAHDVDADPMTFSYAWMRNGTPITGANGPSLDLAIAGNGDRGDTISVTVTAFDGQATSAPVSASVVVGDTAPVTSAVALSSATPRTNDTLNAVASSSDADGDTLTWTFTWKVNGVTRSVISGPNASASFDLSSVGNGDHGDTVSVEVFASDGSLQSGTATASATVANTPPTVTVSLNTSTPRMQDTLTATAVGSDADLDTLSFTFTWQVNGVTKRAVTTASATDSFALKGVAKNGDVVTVAVIASDGMASSAAATATARVSPNGR